MSNQYKIFLDNYLTTLLEFIHTSRRLNKVLISDIETYTKTGSTFDSNSALVLSDWTGKTENGWFRPFHSGLFHNTSQKNYETEIKSVLSREFCFLYCQAYEGLERFFKDCVFYKIENDSKYKDENQEIFRIKGFIDRKNIKGGDILYKAIKKIGKKTLMQLSKKNNSNLKFAELLKVLSEVRHSVIHSKSIINVSEINLTSYHENVFNFLFNYSKINNDQMRVELDFKKFEFLINKLTEFAFQIFKAISIEEQLEWSYEN